MASPPSRTSPGLSIGYLQGMQNGADCSAYPFSTGKRLIVFAQIAGWASLTPSFGVVTSLPAQASRPVLVLAHADSRGGGASGQLVVPGEGLIWSSKDNGVERPCGWPSRAYEWQGVKF